MSSIQITEEPEEIPNRAGLLASTGSAQKSKNALTTGPEGLEFRWDESKWTQEILNLDCIKSSRAKLDGRVANFLAIATDEEQESLSSSRDEFQRLVTAAIEARKLCDPDANADGPSVAERLKHGWSATNAVAYEYVKILDVMVGQAPEYVGLAYGAIKILLVAQVNNEEVKEKVKGYLDQIQLKFEIIDHLTAYMPSSRLVTLIADVYCFFNKFVAKAIKHYTQNRFKRYFVAFTMPWKRFQEIVDSIESRLLSIKDVAQYVGLVEGHTTMMISQQTLALLQHNMAKSQETKELVEEIRFRLDAISLKFSKAEGVRQTADSLANLAEEKLSEPTMADVDTSVSLDNETASNSLATDGIQDFDSWQNTLFPELQKSGEAAARRQRANEELPKMREYRSKRKGYEKSEMAMAWAVSRKSEILWINGNEVLSREDFNASFVRPLMLVGESHFDTFIKLQHFCEDTSGETEPYVVMMQDLVAQVLRQHTSISSQLRMTITRERTSTTEGLWGLLLELVTGIGVSCVFLIIGGIDHMVTHSSRPEKMRAEIVERFHLLTTNTHTIIKIIVAMGFFQSTTTGIENISSIVRAHRPGNQRRRLSLDGLQSAFPGPFVSQHLTDIQEGRCRNIAFTEIPLLYTPGTMVYTQDNERLTMSVVSEMSGMEPRPFGSFAPLRLRVWSIDHDGRQICKRYQNLEINYFAGRKYVYSLACVPSGYLPEETTKRQQIIARGQKYWSYMSGVHYVEIKSLHGNQQGIIDQGARPIDPTLFGPSEPLKVLQGTAVKPRFLMLAPAQISVYSARGLAWSHVDVEKVIPLEFPLDPLRQLNLPNKNKQFLVKSVEAVQTQTEHQQLVPAALKMELRSNTMGRLLLLFHGAPGTGKSLAAQSLANYARRPLLQVRSGMKANEDMFVNFLKGVFKLAERWNCLVLMDHVEVVVCERDTGGLERNAMVTDIISRIESYQGILITTTDRIGTIDDALRTRADLSVEFELSTEIRQRIWTGAIDASGSQICLTQESSDRILEFAKQPLNGHAIRSVIQSASRIARSEQRVMDLKDIESYLQAYNALSDKWYARNRYRIDGEMRAREPGGRNDWKDKGEDYKGKNNKGENRERKDLNDSTMFHEASREGERERGIQVNQG